MKNKTQKSIISAVLVFVLVLGCFAAMPLANAAPAPVPGNPGWDKSYSTNKNIPQLDPSSGPSKDLPNNPRDNASGDKITSNAHSADYLGLYFYWDDKQKDDGVLLVSRYVFDLFEKGKFTLTAKNSNNYWGYTIAPSTGYKVVGTDGVDASDDVYAYRIPKQFQFINENNGKNDKEDLKNINMVFIDGKYKDAKVIVSKLWLDEEGKPFSNAVSSAPWDKLSFNTPYKLGENTITFSTWTEATKGKTVKITEGTIPGYKAEQQSITVTVKAGETAYAKFVNQKQYATIEIVKIWLDADGEIIDEALLAKLEATFTINGKAAVELRKYEVKEGIYTVKETGCTEGYNLIMILVDGTQVTVNDDSTQVTVKAGETKTVTFVNKDPAPPIGRHTFEKLFEDAEGVQIGIDDWDALGYSFADLRAGILFKLYTEHEYERKDFSNPVATATLDDYGVADFSFDLRNRFVGKPFEEGYYWIVEELTGTAKTVFEKADDMRVYITRSSIVDKVNFDYDSKYTIVNGYNLEKHNDGLGYPELNNGGDLFYIGVKNSETGEEFASFCAHGGSVRFAGDVYNPQNLDCTGYMVIFKPGMGALENKEMDKAYYNILAALNWIQDNVGDLRLTDGPYGLVTKQRVVAQTVIWVLLKNIDVDTDAFANANLTEDEREAVLDALNAANVGYVGEITDLVYMVCEKHHNFNDCQPQLVPIYGTTQFFNKLRDNPSGEVSFNKVKYSGLLPIAVEKEFAFDLFKLVNGAEVFVDTFYNDADGVVTATGLEPGSYVFREVVTADFYDAIPGVNGEVWDYRFVWKAFYPNDDDGLYFEIDAKGKTIWPEGYIGEGAKVPTVNNKLVPKTDMLWELTKTTGAPGLTIEEYRGKEGGFIRSNAGCGGILQATVIAATCTTPEIVRLTCDCGGDSNHLSHVGIDITRGKALEHDVSYTTTWNYGECYQVCSRGCSLPPCDNEEFWNTCGDKCGHTWADLTAAVTSCADCGQTVNTNTLPSLQP